MFYYFLFIWLSETFVRLFLFAGNTYVFNWSKKILNKLATKLDSFIICEFKNIDFKFYVSIFTRNFIGFFIYNGPHRFNFIARFIKMSSFNEFSGFVYSFFKYFAVCSIILFNYFIFSLSYKYFWSSFETKYFQSWCDIIFFWLDVYFNKFLVYIYLGLFGLYY